MSVAIVTLTRFPEIFKRFAASIDRHEPEYRRIVVTSGGATIDDESWEVVIGEEPFVCGRNMNAGIKAAGESDVLLVNDDVVLTMPIIETLAEILEGNPKLGAITPQVLGDIGNPDARVGRHRGEEWFVTNGLFPFVCVLLRREALNKAGLLLECFDGYGGDDEEWGIRARKAGYDLAIAPCVHIEHGYGRHKASSSFLRVMTEEQRLESMAKSRALVRELHPC